MPRVGWIVPMALADVQACEGCYQTMPKPWQEASEPIVAGSGVPLEPACEFCGGPVWAKAQAEAPRWPRFGEDWR